jgi:nucleoside-diphosphate-sugar epimerase
MKRVIVTGATGFIGRHTLPKLVSRGYDVHAVALPANDPDLFAGVHYHYVDLLDAAAVDALCHETRASHLLHLAWYVEHGKFWNASENRDWVAASARLITSFESHGGERAVAAGTCVEYDLTGERPLSEDCLLKPNTIYGECKKQFSEVLATSGLSSAWGRVFFVYGEYEHPKRLVASVINSLLRDEPARLSHGNQVRDLLNTKDVADAFVALLDSEVEGAVNIGSGEPVTIREVALRIAEMMSKRENIHFGVLPLAPDEPQYIVADVTRLRNDLLWNPAYTLKEGLMETIQWWQNRSEY